MFTSILMTQMLHHHHYYYYSVRLLHFVHHPRPRCLRHVHCFRLLSVFLAPVVRGRQPELGRPPHPAVQDPTRTAGSTGT